MGVWGGTKWKKSDSKSLGVVDESLEMKPQGGALETRYANASWQRGVTGSAQVRAGRSRLAGLLLLGMMVLSMLTTATAGELADAQCYTQLTETSTRMQCSEKSLRGK